LHIFGVQEMRSPDHMLNIGAELVSLFRGATTAAFPDLPGEAPCPVVPSAKFADYQFNGAMVISGLLKVCCGVVLSRMNT
jgi:hypothetical protein